MCVVARDASHDSGRRMQEEDAAAADVASNRHQLKRLVSSDEDSDSGYKIYMHCLF